MLLKVIEVASGIERFIPCPLGFTYQPNKPNSDNEAVFCIKVGNKMWDEINVVKGEEIVFLENDKGETIEKFQWALDQDMVAYKIS